MPSEVTNKEPSRNLKPSVRRRIVKFVKILAAAVLALFAWYLVGVVGIVYILRPENDPFINPVEISEVGSDRINLKDGRSFVPYGGVSDRTKLAISEAKMRMDMEVDETNLVRIYGRHEIFVCPLGMQMITVPIIPRKIPKYNRTLLDIGELDGLPRTTELRDCPEEERCGAEPHG